MLRASLLADAIILPQPRLGSYFFNRIGYWMLTKSAIDSKLLIDMGLCGSQYQNNPSFHSN